MGIMQVDENEYRALKGAHNLLDSLMKDQKLRPYTEKLIKAKHPNVQTSEDNPIVSEFRSLQKEIRADKEERENERIQQKLDASFNKLRKEYNYTDEGIEKIKKIMVDESIPNPEAAAAYWEKRNPPKAQEPSIYEPDSWGLNRGGESDENLKLLWSDEDAWANREIQRAFTDFRKNADE